jgi:hypothetical protein
MDKMIWQTLARLGHFFLELSTRQFALAVAWLKPRQLPQRVALPVKSRHLKFRHVRTEKR